MLRYFSLWVSIGWFMVAMICFLSLTSNPPGMEIDIKYIDKAGHFISYFILMFWFAQIFKTTLLRSGYGLFFVILGTVLEVIQGMGGVRYFEYSDMLANACGVLIAWFITRGKLKNLLLSFEQVMIK